MKRLFFLVLVLSVCAFFGNEGWFKLYRLKKVEHSLEEENRNLKGENGVLLREIRDLKDTRYVEHYIRDVLGFIREDEISYETSQTP